jgi:hypothetical protein
MKTVSNGFTHVDQQLHRAKAMVLIRAARQTELVPSILDALAQLAQ